MKKSAILSAILALAFTIQTTEAQFSIIPGLNNTGVDSGGSLLPNGAIDSDWVLTSSPPGTGPLTYAGDPIPPNWLPNTSASRWITPDPVGTVGFAAGTYDFTYTFDLTGFDETTASIMGIWASDNSSTILVNGSGTGITHSGGATAFLQWDNFSLDSSNSTFNAGINTMTFRVNNSGGPTGLHVGQIDGRAIRTVPEPASACIFGLISAWGLVRRRRPIV